MNRVLIVVFATTLIVNADVKAEERSDEFVGCYKLELGRWTRVWIFPAEVARHQIPPSAFHLIAELGK